VYTLDNGNTMKVFLLANQKFKDLFQICFLQTGLSIVTGSPKSADLLYIVDGSLFLSKLGIYWAIFFSILRKKVIVHWIGTDVLDVHRAAQHSKNLKWIVKIGLLKLFNKLSTVSNFAGADHLKDELNQINIHSIFVAVPGYQVEYNIRPLPLSPAALTYVPKGREVFYGLPLILRLAQCNSEMDFFIVAHSGEGLSSPENVHFLGWLTRRQMDDLYYRCSCILRLTEHDALAGTVLEGVARGRYAVWTYPSEYSFLARNFDEAQKALLSIRGMTEPNEDGARIVAARFGSEKLISTWKTQVLRELAQ
jgi:glycosyltransferase involved in cell wall biosynthesis